MLTRKNIIIGSVVAMLIIWFLSMLYVFRKGKNTEALLYAQVPQETIDFLNKFIHSFDIKLIYNPNPDTKDWKNDLNFGEDKRTGLKKVEDENFIVYFDDKSGENEKAVQIIGYAYEAIPGLINLMGKYYYPATVNNRKLPIYLASDENHYTELYRNILKNITARPPVSSVGLYLATYSGMGNVTLGIILHSKVWNNRQDKLFAKQVLWHEMNHYVFFTAIQYDKVVKPYTWVYEGLAEYFSNPPISLSTQQASFCQSLSLTQEFQNHNANYWAGQTIYQFFEQFYSIQEVKNFIHHSSSTSTEIALRSAFNTSVSNIEWSWKDYVYSITK